MKHRKLGKSDLQVSVVGLGCNNFGFVANMDVAASRKVIDKAIDSGINFFDTSDSYGTSENILGEVLGERRKKIVLATKFGSKLNALGEKSGALARLHPGRSAKRACGACAPTGSTSTRFTIPIPRRRSKRPCAPSTIW